MWKNSQRYLEHCLYFDFPVCILLWLKKIRDKDFSICPRSFPSSINIHLVVLIFQIRKSLPTLISWDWTSPYENCALFVYSLPVSPYICHHQVVVSMTSCCTEWSDIKYTWMLSPIYQNTFNSCVFPSGDAQVNLWTLRCGNIVLFTVRFLDVAMFTTLILLSLLIPCKL
jgi:hypothetical protein